MSCQAENCVALSFSIYCRRSWILRRFPSNASSRGGVASGFLCLSAVILEFEPKEFIFVACKRIRAEVCPLPRYRRHSLHLFPVISCCTFRTRRRTTRCSHTLDCSPCSLDNDGNRRESERERWSDYGRTVHPHQNDTGCSVHQNGTGDSHVDRRELPSVGCYCSAKDSAGTRDNGEADPQMTRPLQWG